MSENQLDRKDLKVQALRERIAQLSVEHEDRASDLRVEVTLLNQQLQEFAQKNVELQARLDEFEVTDVPVQEDDTDSE